MIKFGPSGNDKLFYEEGNKESSQAPKWLNGKGLNAYEYSFGKGILLKDETAVKIGEEAQKYGIEISVHAPYYINLACVPDEQGLKNEDYIIRSIEKLRLLGGNRLVVHPGSQGKLTREEAISITKNRLEQLAKTLKEKQMDDIYICLETMGKQAQIGTFEEIIDFCTISKNYIPTFDFGHINALTGGTLKTEKDYKKIFDLCFQKLGFEKTKICHIHFSHIEYGAKGEIKHLTFEDKEYGPFFEPLAKVIKEYGLTPFIICESKEVMAQDAIQMKEIYNAL